MATEKLYFADPFRSSLETGEALQGQFKGKPSIDLDCTIFYPEAGAQLADTERSHGPAAPASPSTARRIGACQALPLARV